MINTLLILATSALIIAALYLPFDDIFMIKKVSVEQVFGDKFVDISRFKKFTYDRSGIIPTDCKCYKDHIVKNNIG